MRKWYRRHTRAPSIQVAKLYPLPMINNDLCWNKDLASSFTLSFSCRTWRISVSRFFNPLMICWNNKWTSSLITRHIIELQCIFIHTYLLTSGAKGDPVLAHDQSKHHKGNELRGVGLRTGHANLRTGVYVNAAMRFATDTATHSVGDTNDQRSTTFAIAKSQQSICCFAYKGIKLETESSKTIQTFNTLYYWIH